ncbi:N-acetylmuramoyl-L-alanine amidase [Gracilibacillus caseinilyticus]|uniref:N-acetylmuramoyl-L-alanine amidase n=1 Tax=Gracilibacillus caseinilyticus TaxID=2932256 RepID=A0ABY4ESC6_9BACI|nr:N-acetylmuramoyl-L-alanine amidase [Gracilibacillus caseinilyticus]UOQ47334.1 N-acetylmuramoyl-L-alanine amidase [Gracilibacillus caseinilyticus]
MKKLLILTMLGVIVIFSMSYILYANDAEINGENLNVRTGPGTDYEVITQVNPPETYPILQQEGAWVQIDLGDQQGWIHQDYMKEIASSSEQEVQEEPEITEQKQEQDNATIASQNESIPVVTTNSSKDLSGKIIVLDPGHGGRDVGAIGVSGAYESHYTLRTALIIQELLEQYGAKVYLTREQDRYVPLSSRTTFANLKKADVFLSIHYNSTPELPEVTGIDTYYYSERDKQLANYVHQNMVLASGMDDRGFQQRDLQVLRINHRPSLLLELGFVSNEAEEEKVQSRAYLESVSRGIINGLQLYFQ